jgi:hypothetical protein
MFKKKNLMDELTDYIRKNLKKGYTKESLRWALLDQDYSKIEVDKALKRVDKELADMAPILKTKPEITYELVEPKSDEPKKTGWRKWF